MIICVVIPPIPMLPLAYRYMRSRFRLLQYFVRLCDCQCCANRGRQRRCDRTRFPVAAVVLPFGLVLMNAAEARQHGIQAEDRGVYGTRQAACFLSVSYLGGGGGYVYTPLRQLQYLSVACRLPGLP